MAKKARKCPECGGEAVPILYGLPSIEYAEALRRGEIHLWGCVVEEDEPSWHCKACESEW